MKKIIFLSLLFLNLFIKAQDTIYFKNNTTEIAKILEVNPNNIKYNYFTYLDGPLLNADNSTITKIVFKNGIVKQFNDVYFPIPTRTNVSYQTLLGKGADTLKTESEINNSFYKKGIVDANLYYKNNSAGISTGIVSFFCIPCGLITAFACNSVEPKNANLNYPDPNLFAYQNYQLAYKNRAYKLKKQRVWNGFIYGTVFSFTLGFTIYALTYN